LRRLFCSWILLKHPGADLGEFILALDQNLTIIPVVNKIDLPAADVAKTKKEIIDLLGCKEEEIIALPEKTGAGVTEI